MSFSRETMMMTMMMVRCWVSPGEGRDREMGAARECVRSVAYLPEKTTSPYHGLRSPGVAMVLHARRVSVCVEEMSVRGSDGQ